MMKQGPASPASATPAPADKSTPQQPVVPQKQPKKLGPDPGSGGAAQTPPFRKLKGKMTKEAWEAFKAELDKIPRGACLF